MANGNYFHIVQLTVMQDWTDVVAWTGHTHSGHGTNEMSYLSNELQSLLRKKGLLQKDVTKKTGLAVSLVSRVFSGVQVFVDDEDLDKIIGAIANTEEERARVLRARMRDAYRGQFAGLVKINIKGGAPPAERFTPNDVSIDPSVNAAVAYLYSLVPTNPQVGELLTGLARAMGWKE